jgi:hypothetical protein
MRETAERLRAAYDRLLDGEPPTGMWVARTIRAAERNGYPPPEAWSDRSIEDPDAVPFDWMDPNYVDEVKVDRTLRFIAQNPLLNKRVRRPSLWGPLTQPERRAVVTAMLRWPDMTVNAVARNLGLHVSSLRTWLAKHGIEVST